MGKLLLKNGRVIDPVTSTDHTLDILVEGEQIAEIGEGLSAGDAETIDCAGKIVTPGLVDLRCQLREPGQEESETIASGAQAAAAGGFTTVVCMPNTTPVLDTAAAVEYVADLARRQPYCKVVPAGAVTKKLEGNELADIGEMNERGVTLLTDANSTIINSKVMRRAMEYAATFGMKLMSHCEDTSLTKNGTANEGIMTARLGFRVMPAASEDILVYRDIRLAEYLSLPLHISRVSSAESVRLIRDAKDRGVPVTCDVTIQHLVLNEEALEGFDTVYKLNPPLRTEEDRQALIQAFADGTIDCLVSDHAPLHPDYKQCEFDIASFGCSSLETCLALAIDRLVAGGAVGWERLIEGMAAMPGMMISGEAASLTKGAAADITVIDPELEWVVEPLKFNSLGRNTPFAGERLKGRATATIVNGALPK